MSKGSMKYAIPVGTWSELSTSATEERAATLHLKKRLRLSSRKRLPARGWVFTEPQIGLHSSAFSVARRWTGPVSLYFNCNMHVCHTCILHCFQTLYLQCFSAWKFSCKSTYGLLLFGIENTTYRYRWLTLKRKCNYKNGGDPQDQCSPITGKHFSCFLHVPTRLMQKPLLYLLKLNKPEEVLCFACPSLRKALCSRTL